MRILRVRARAFGPFHRKEFSFRAGLNVVWGLNEAGKSSLHAAVFAGLCGMRRGKGRPTKQDEEFASLHRPWRGGEWIVELDLERDEGCTLQFIQNLNNLADCKVLDLATGRDITPQFENEGTPDGARLLGLSRATLLSTIFIRQADMLRVLETASQLQDDIQRAAATAGADETAEGAITRLKVFHSERVGTLRANSTKPLKKASDEVKRLRGVVEDARDAHEQYLDLVGEYNAAKGAAERADLLVQAGRREAALRTLKSLDSRLERARLLSAMFPDGEPLSLSEGQELLGRVQDALVAWDRCPQQPPALVGESSDEIRSQLAALPEPPDGDTEVNQEVEDAEDAWRTARGRGEAHAETEPPAVETPATGGLSALELRRLAEELEASAPAITPELENQIEELEGDLRVPVSNAAWSTALAIGATLLSAGAGFLAFGASNLRWAGLVCSGFGLALLLAGVLWRRHPRGVNASGQRLSALRAELEVQRATARQLESRRSGARVATDESGLPPDPAVLRRLAVELDEAESRRPMRRRWQERQNELGKTERIEMERLRAALLSRVGQRDGPLGALLVDYKRQCRANARQAELASRRDYLTRMLDNRLEAEAAHERYQTQRAETDQLIREVGFAAGIAEAEPVQMITRLRDTKSEMVQHQTARLADREKWIELQGILDGRSFGGFEEQVERRRRELPPPVALDEEPVWQNDIEADLVALRRRAQQARSHRDSLFGQVEERKQSLPDVAGTEEQLEDAATELANIKRLNATLETTLEFMESARDRVQRDIAPRLVGSIQPHLPKVTAGRYDEVMVDPASLVIRVRPSGGDWHEATRLSQGTREQIYLLARLALAEHLVTTEESPPLVLDDVTIQFDVDRARAFLDLLHEISTRQQIILFSQEQEVLDWAKERLSHDKDKLTQLTVGPLGVP